MEKFKVLQRNQKFLNRIGIHLDGGTNSTYDIFTYFLDYHVPISQIMGLIISAAFIWKYPTEIKPALGALKICIAVSQCAGMFLGVRSKVKTMTALQNVLQEIVDKGISIFASSKYLISLTETYDSVRESIYENGSKLKYPLFD